MIWKIHPSQLRRVNKLVKTLCSCYDRGNCILLDDGDPHKCVQIISCSGIYCNYFKRAVLPADKELYEQIKKYNNLKKEKCKMKKFNEMYVIGIDHGYGNMKTANCCFPTGVMKSDTEPTFVIDLLYWNGKYYSIGVGHKEFTADKFNDEDYYVLTLAAIARELRREHITDAAVFIAAGLPLTWVSEQKADFKKYLLQHSEVTFTFRNTEYHIKIAGAEIYPQGFAAVAEKLGNFKGVNMLCDIGNGTMNFLRIVNKKPDAQRMFTEKYGTHQCALLIREQMMKVHHAALDDTIVTEILKKGTADIDKQYLDTVIKTAKEYTAGIFRRLREHEYDPKLMKLYVVGGGGCLIRNFADYDASRVIINEDICATAKGYEYMALVTLNRNGGVV